MQLFAQTSDGRVKPACRAIAGIDYKCLECDQPVRVRAGHKRVRHYYHRRRTGRCGQRGKSLTHLRIQERLEAQIEGVQLEHPFPTIGRIADVFWPEQNLVFEVQCSPIAAEEVAARNRDYERLGLQVVWILHDRRFNRRHVTAAEHLLHNKPHYYTDIDSRGSGLFYDQRRFPRQGRRLRVELDRPLGGGRFAGDASCHPDYMAQLRTPRPRPSFAWLVRPYQIIFRLVLEKMC